MCAVLPSAECGGGFNPGLLILKARQLCSSSEWMAQGPKGATVCQLPQQQPCARQDGCSHCLCLLQVEDQAEPRLLLFNDVCPVQRHLLRAGRFGAGGGEEMVIFHFSHASLCFTHSGAWLGFANPRDCSLCRRAKPWPACGCKGTSASRACLCVVSQLVEERLVTITVTSSSNGEVPTLQLMRVEAAGHCCV